MDEQGYRFGVGVLVVASLVIAVILILFFGAAPNFFTERYLVTIRFEAAPNVATDTPVRKNGVQIGRVKAVQLLDEDGVDLTLELDAEYKVRSRELPRIGTGSIITGDAVVEFIPPTQESLLERFDGTGGSSQDGILDENEKALASALLKDGDFFRGGRVAADPLDALLNMQKSFGTTFSTIETAGSEITALAHDLRQMIGGGDGQIQEIAQKMEQTIDNFNHTLNGIDELFRDQNLKQTLSVVATRLPELVDNAEQVMQQTSDTLAAFEDVGRAAEETVKNVTELTEPLAKHGEQIVSGALKAVDDTQALMAELRKTAVTVNQLAARINSGQGTFAKLVDDPELYYTVVRTIQNIETLTRRMHPIVEDVRVLTNRVSRDPASLIDLRGAITGRPRGGVR